MIKNIIHTTIPCLHEQNKVSLLFLQQRRLIHQKSDVNNLLPLKSSNFNKNKHIHSSSHKKFLLLQSYRGNY